MYCVVDVVLSLAVKGDGNRGLLAGFPCLHAATMFCWLTIFRVRCQGRLVVTVFFFLPLRSRGDAQPRGFDKGQPESIRVYQRYRYLSAADQ